MEVQSLWIPIPIDWAGLLLMGFGCLFWLSAVSTFFNWVKQIRKGEPFEKWNPLTEDFIEVSPASQLKMPLVLVLIGLGFFIFGYLVYTKLIYEFLIPH